MILKWSYYHFVYKFYIDKYVYDYADIFVEGLARVKKDGKWHYLNLYGDYSEKQEYDEETRFDHGFAFVKKDGGWFILSSDSLQVEKVRRD